MLLCRGDLKDSASQFAAGVGSIVSTAQGSDGEQSAAQQQQGSGFRDVRSYVDVERHIADFVSGLVVQTALRLSQLRSQPHALERPLQATRNRALEALAPEDALGSLRKHSVSVQPHLPFSTG